MKSTPAGGAPQGAAHGSVRMSVSGGDEHSLFMLLSHYCTADHHSRAALRRVTAHVVKQNKTTGLQINQEAFNKFKCDHQPSVVELLGKGQRIQFRNRK